MLDVPSQFDLVLVVRDAVQEFIDGVLGITLSVEDTVYAMTTPKEIALITHGAFAELFSRHEDRLTRQYGHSVTGKIWAQHRSLKDEYQVDRRFRNNVEIYPWIFQVLVQHTTNCHRQLEPTACHTSRKAPHFPKATRPRATMRCG